MSTKVLAKLFSSDALIKILRLFFNHPDTPFDIEAISKRTRTTTKSARTEVAILKNISFLKSKSYTEQVKRGKKTVSKKKSGFIINPEFPHLKPLRELIFSSGPLKKKEIEKRFKGIGQVKCMVVSGVFIQDPHSRADILIAGDRLKKSSLEQSLKIIEAEMGKEIRYAVYDTKEFQYRLNVYDKFIRDILDYPHEVIIDKIGLK